MVFSMFSAFLNFEAKLIILKRPCMGYSLCKVDDCQNCLISRIFGVFSSGLQHRTTPTMFQNGFSHAFGIFNFRPNLTILQRLQPLHGLYTLQDGRFSQLSHFSNIWCFFERFFAQNNSHNVGEWFLPVFGIFNFGPKLTILQSLQPLHGL